jgi:hypothetical protein
MGKIKGLKMSFRRGFSIDAFEKRYGCTVHMQTESTPRLYRTSGKEFKKSALKSLIDKGLISHKQVMCVTIVFLLLTVKKTK